MKQLRNEVIECLDNNDETNIILALDMIYCTAFNITTNELDSLVEHMSEDDLESWSKVLAGNPTFTEKKQLLKFRNKHLNYFYEQSSRI
jgi:activator of 2-hydroxyglutaryl-CoA dehydratase